MSEPIQPRSLVIGQILRPHGIRGEVRMQVMTGHPDRIQYLDSVLLTSNADDEDGKHYAIERARLHQGIAILKIQDLDDRTAADKLRGRFVKIPIEDAVPLEEGEFYQFQLIGLTMVTDDGMVLGEVTDILETGANEVYIVQSLTYGEVLIPAIESVVQTIDLEKRQITITPLPGMLPSDA